MEPMQEPLLCPDQTPDETTDTTETSTRTPDWRPSDAELQLLHASSSTMLSSLRRLFLPKLTSTQLLAFFNRAPGPRQLDTPYHIRPALFTDIPQQALLQSRADWSMPAMRIFHPLKEVYPADYLRAFYEADLMWMTKPGALTYVAVRPYAFSGGNENGGMEEVIGAIRFSRQGDGKKSAERQHGWVGMVVDYFMRVYLRFWRSNWVKPLRSQKMDTEAQKNAAQRSVENFEAMEEKYWKRGELKERYYVATVCVKDEWRGRGVGRRLMKVATRRCNDERLPLTLSATEDGVHLYRKMGFERLDEYDLPGGGVGAHYEFMVWDPRKRD